MELASHLDVRRSVIVRQARRTMRVQQMLDGHTGIVVRSARRSDCSQLADIFCQSWRGAYRGIIPHTTLEAIINRRGSMWWARALKGSDRLIVLEFDRTLAGYATFGPARGANPKRRGEIYELYLAPSYQGLGLGEYLFEACRNRLDQTGHHGLIVWALGANTQATDFYWRRGGRPIAATQERVGGHSLEKIAFAWA